MKIKGALAFFLVTGVLAVPAQAQNTVTDPYANRRPEPVAPVQQPSPSVAPPSSVPTLPSVPLPSSSALPKISPTAPLPQPKSMAQPKSMSELQAEAEARAAEVIQSCRAGRAALVAVRTTSADLTRRSIALEKRLTTWQTKTSAVISVAPSVAEARGRLAVAQQRLRDVAILAEGGAGGACGALEAAKKDNRTSAQRQFLTDAREGAQQAQAAANNRVNALQQCQAAAQELRTATASIPASLAAEKSLSGDVLALRNLLQDRTAKGRAVVDAAAAVVRARDDLVKTQEAADELRAASVADDDPATYARITKAVKSAPDCSAELETGAKVAETDGVVARAEATARRTEEVAASPTSRALEATLSAREAVTAGMAACRNDSTKINAVAPQAASCLSGLESLSGAAVARQAADLESARRRCPPGSRPQWNDTQNTAECACPTAEGMTWNADQSACNSRASFNQWATEQCRAELQGSVVASGDPVTGRYSCRCPSGLTRANDGRSCLDTADLRAHCNRLIWGSEPIEAYSDGRVQCGCPRGSESYRGECVRADLYDSPLRRSYPFGGGSVFDRDRDRDRCYRDRFNGRIYCDRL